MGAPMNEKNSGGQTGNLISKLIKKTKIAKEFHYASFKGNLAIVKYLLDHGAKINEKNIHGQTGKNIRFWRNFIENSC